MDNIEKKLNERQNEIKEELAYLEFLGTLKNYDGDDRIITSLEVKEDIEKNKKEDELVIYSGIPSLDGLLEGFLETQLIVLSAPTGQGKTSFAQTLTTKFAQDNISCLWFSFEVGYKGLLKKFTEIPMFTLPRKNTQGNLEWLELKIMESIAKYGTKVVFIDHLHFLMNMDQLARANTSIVIGDIVRKIKSMAVKHNIIIFLIAHMKKVDIERGQKIPTVDDLRDSSFIAQESNTVIMLWREKERNSASKLGYDYTNKTNLIVVKNRDVGKLGYVEMIYENNIFRELDKFYDNN